jgi:hypothetical protein
MMRELKYNDYNSSLSISNRYSTNISNYLSYNNIHYHHQQVQFKHLSSRNRQQIHTNHNQRIFLRSYRYSEEYQENSTNKVKQQQQ